MLDLHGRRPWVLLAAAVLVVWGGTVLFQRYGGVVRGEVGQAVGVRHVEAHAELLRRLGEEADLDPCLLAGIMFVESRGKVDAVSSAGAMGLMQLAQSAAGDAAKRLGLETPTREQLLSDPELNVRLACSHINWILKHEGENIVRVLVAYNAGRGRLRKWVKQAGSYELWLDEREAAGNSEVLLYAQRVLKARKVFRDRGRFDV